MKSVKLALLCGLGFSSLGIGSMAHATAQDDSLKSQIVETIEPLAEPVVIRKDVNTCKVQKPITFRFNNQDCLVNGMVYELELEKEIASPNDFYKTKSTALKIFTVAGEKYKQCPDIMTQSLSADAIDFLRREVLSQASDERNSCYRQYEKSKAVASVAKVSKKLVTVSHPNGPHQVVHLPAKAGQAKAAASATKVSIANCDDDRHDQKAKPVQKSDDVNKQVSDLLNGGGHSGK